MSVQMSFLEEEASSPADQVSGLTYFPNFITPVEEAALLAAIDQQPWLTDLKRRVQHYGWKYDYTARRVDESMRLEPPPNWLMAYCQRLYNGGYFPKIPDQVIINEYQPGQGIARHVDCVPCFEEAIASLSLGSPCAMEFMHLATGEKTTQILEPCSLTILKGDARYKWKHGIAARRTDKYGDKIIHRERRISLTFRNVVLHR